jgi:hypothetical protein
MTRRGNEFDDIELVVSTKWRDSGCLFLVAPAKAGAQGHRRCARRPGCPLSHDGEVGECRTLEAYD